MAPDQQLVATAEPDNIDDLEIDFQKLIDGLPAQQQAVRGPILRNGIKPVHEAFADYMLVNPACTLRQMSAHFGYTPSWICQVINSDMFKAYFAKRRQGIEVSIAQDLPTRLQAAAHLATERVIEVIQTSSDPDVLVDAFDKVLMRCGYAPNAKGAQPATAIDARGGNNMFFLQKDELAAAREKLISSHKEKEVLPALPAPAE